MLAPSTLQMHAAISQDRADVAVAGTRGLAVYSRRARRWRLFGDATQERGLRVRRAGRRAARRETWQQACQRVKQAYTAGLAYISSLSA